MNICKLKHNWEYYKEEYNPYDGIYDVGTGLNKHKHIAKAFVRKCKRCNKKQEAVIGSGVYNFKLKKYCFWTPCELTEQEARDFKLRKLGL
jgi:hypothetical protein